MTKRKRQNLHDLPIPQDVQPSRYWTADMREMADHIGAYATLLLVDALGGTAPYVAINAKGSKFAEIIGADKAKILHRIYEREHLHIPVADAALRHARRAGVLAAIRAKTMTLTEAALIRGMGSRTYISNLLNNTKEGVDTAPLAVADGRRGARQLALFDDEAA